MLGEALVEWPILGVECRVVESPLRVPIHTANYTARVLFHVLVKMHVRGGFTGISHGFAFSRRRAAILRAMVLDLGKLVVSKSCRDPLGLWDLMRRDVAFLGTSGVAMTGVSLVDSACWDAAAQTLGMPLWALLGGRPKTVKSYASSGLWLGTRPEECRSYARDAIEAGFIAVKLRLGKVDLTLWTEQVHAVMSAVGTGDRIMVDANQSWDVEGAKAACGWAEGLELRWVEEPVAADDVSGLREVAKGSKVPIAAGESWFGTRIVEDAVAKPGISVFMPDLQRIGGVTGFLEAVDVASAAGAEVSPHLFPEMSSQVLVGLGLGGPIEHVPWFEHLLDSSPRTDTADYGVSDRPGWGFSYRSGVW